MQSPMQTASRTFIVCGLAAAGKSTLAKTLALKQAVGVVHADVYRYVKAWAKRDAAVFVPEVLAACTETLARSGGYVFESTYYDAHDAQQARIAAIHELIDVAPLGAKPTIVVIADENIEDALSTVIERSCSPSMAGK